MTGQHGTLRHMGNANVTALFGPSPPPITFNWQARVVERILRHLEVPTDRPPPRPARAPPHVDDLAFRVAAPADATF